MSHRLSLDAPPDTGKTSRRESVARSGRSRTSSVDNAQPSVASPRSAGAIGKGSLNTANLFVIQDDVAHDGRGRGTSDASDFDPLSMGVGNMSLGVNGTRPTRAHSAYVGPAAPYADAQDPFGSTSPQNQAPSPTKLPYAQKMQRIEDALNPKDPFGSSGAAKDPFASTGAAFPSASTGLTSQPGASTAAYNPFDVFDSSFGATKAAPSAVVSAGASSLPNSSSTTTSPVKPKSPKSKSPKNKKNRKEGEKEKKKKKKKGEVSSEEEESDEDDDDDDEEEESDDSDDDGKAEDMKKVKPFPPSSPPPNHPPGQQQATGALAPPGFDATQRRHSAPSPPTMKVDVLAYMKKGTPFLKYGKHGYPHFRQFQLSDDNSKLMWFSQSKKLKDTQIDLSDVDELRLGQTTPIFARHRAPELAKSSFSIIYAHGRKSLDLIAKDPNEFRIWTEGLSQLLKKAKMGDYHTVENLKNLVIDVPVVTGRRSSVEIVDAFTGKNADQTLGEDEMKQTRERAPSTGNKQMYKEVAKSFAALKKKLQKRKDELRESQYYMAPAYESMQVIVKRVDESIIKCNDWFQDGEYPLCDDEIWRAGVDLESLKNMMKAVKG